MNQMPYPYMPNQMMPMPHHNNDQQFDKFGDLEAKINRLERQIKRLEHRVSKLEGTQVMPLSSKNAGYGNNDSGMYMM